MSTGDYAFEVEYPAVSPNVIAVGGTSISRDVNTGNYTGETYWDHSGYGGGGGLSQYEGIPSYQGVIQNIVGSHRGVPDLSMDADPLSGVAFYDSFPYAGNQEGWLQASGTSMATPLIAGRVAAVGIVPSTRALQNYTYGEYGSGTAYSTSFRDITSGANACVSGWDSCSGIGSPLGDLMPPAPPFLPTQAKCSGNVTNPLGPTVGGNGQLADMSSGGGGKNNAVATCTYSGFTASNYVTTAPVTLSFGAYADAGAAGRATISVSLFGTVISDSYSGTYRATIPANTDLSTLTVTGYVKVSGIPGDEADVEVSNIIVQ